MRNLIWSLVGAIVIALLAVLGLNFLKGKGPRERIKAEDGSKIIVEEVSYYRGNDKIFGKLFKPADENGFYPDSLGPRPVVAFFHEPLKTAWPESIVKSLVPKGIVGYVCAFHGKEKDVRAVIKRLSKEKFADPDLIFVVSDGSCGNEVLDAVAKIGHNVAGLVLVEPKLTGKSAELYHRYGKEFLTVGTERKGEAVDLIEDYLETHGALK